MGTLASALPPALGELASVRGSLNPRGPISTLFTGTCFRGWGDEVSSLSVRLSYTTGRSPNGKAGVSGRGQGPLSMLLPWRHKYWGRIEPVDYFTNQFLLSTDSLEFIPEQANWPNLPFCVNFPSTVTMCGSYVMR